MKFGKSMDKRVAQDLKNSWRNCNTSTVGFITNIPAEKFHEIPFKTRFKSFAWEFADIARTRLCYLKALKTGSLNFSDRSSVPNKDKLSREEKSVLQKLLNETSRNILKEIEKIKSSEKVSLVIWLLQHERIHQGKLLLYCSWLKLELPQSFVKTWGEINFK